MMPSANVSASLRASERIRTPSGEELDAWLYPPEGVGRTRSL